MQIDRLIPTFYTVPWHATSQADLTTFQKLHNTAEKLFYFGGPCYEIGTNVFYKRTGFEYNIVEKVQQVVLLIFSFCLGVGILAGFYLAINRIVRPQSMQNDSWQKRTYDEVYRVLNSQETPIRVTIFQNEYTEATTAILITNIELGVIEYRAKKDGIEHIDSFISLYERPDKTPTYGNGQDPRELFSSWSSYTSRLQPHLTHLKSNLLNRTP